MNYLECDSELLQTDQNDIPNITDRKSGGTIHGTHDMKSNVRDSERQDDYKKMAGPKVVC